MKQAEAAGIEVRVVEPPDMSELEKKRKERGFTPTGAEQESS